MPLNERAGSIFQLCSSGMGASPEGSATLNHLLHSKLQQCHEGCFSHRTRHYCARGDSSTSQTGCPHTYNLRIRSIAGVCSAQYGVCAKGQSAVIPPFPLPGIQQQLSQTPTHREGKLSFLLNMYKKQESKQRP